MELVKSIANSINNEINTIMIPGTINGIATIHQDMLGIIDNFNAARITVKIPKNPKLTSNFKLHLRVKF